MATLVRHRESGARYITLGAGFGRGRSQVGVSESSRMIAVCDAAGKISWQNADDLVVVSVDGQTPSTLLGDDGYR